MLVQTQRHNTLAFRYISVCRYTSALLIGERMCGFVIPCYCYLSPAISPAISLILRANGIRDEVKLALGI